MQQSLDRMVVRMPAIVRYSFVGLGALGAFGGLQGLSSNTLTALLGILGGAVLIVLGLWRGDIIDIGPDGLRIDASGGRGFVPWSNFERTGVFSQMGMSQLGIAVRDRNVSPLDTSFFPANFLLLAGRLQFSNVSPTQKVIMGAAGMAPVPSGKFDPFAYQRASTGYDYAFPLVLVPDKQSYVSRIERHRPQEAPQPSPLLHPPPPGQPAFPHSAPEADAAAAAMKICPMCAEPVRRAARICRFCGYSFDTAAPAGGA